MPISILFEGCRNLFDKWRWTATDTETCVLEVEKRKAKVSKEESFRFCDVVFNITSVCLLPPCSLECSLADYNFTG